MDQSEFRRFFNASNPARPLDIGKIDDCKYYIDFSSVRGGEILKELKRTIVFSDEKTCQIFTGHRGSGKSTELLRLKTELEEQGFYVVYFDSDQDLDLTDVDISDILLVTARRISESLETINISLKPSYFSRLFNDLSDFFNTPLELEKVQLSVGISKITTKAKESPRLRSQLREILEPQTNTILDAINQDIIIKACEKLRQKGKQGLVVIIDNLEKIAPRRLTSGQDNLEYLFIERGAQLRGLACHKVYTVPLHLIFSDQREIMIDQFGGGIPPRILPMVPVKSRNNSENQEGLTLLKQMVMARAFPNEQRTQQLVIEKIQEVFDRPETLSRLCLISGGRIRNLLSLLLRCLQMQDPPIPRSLLERAIRDRREQYRYSINEEIWSLLRWTAEHKQLNRQQSEYQVLFRNSLIFEYQDEEGSWFDVNPILMESPEME